MPKNRGGRPRIYPEGTTAADRVAIGRRRLKASGGHTMIIDLNASAWAALQKMVAKGQRAPFIEQLVLDEFNRRLKERDE